MLADWEGAAREWPCFGRASGLFRPVPASADRGRGLIFLFGTSHNDLEHIFGQWPLQCLGFIPGRPHPNLTFLVRRQDHRHGLRMDWLNDAVRRRGEEAIDKVRAGYRLRFRAAVAFELGPYPTEREKRA